MGIVLQRCRGALGGASPAILNGSSQSIGFGELPRVVVGQATPMRVGGNIQCKVESTVCGGVCWACAGRVPASVSVCRVERPMAACFFSRYMSPRPQTVTSALLCAL